MKPKPKPSPPPFGETLKRLRQERGLSSYSLARRAGLTLPALRDIEERGAEPKWNTVVKLARALGVGVDAFTRE